MMKERLDQHQRNLEFEKYNVDDAENGVEGLKMAMSTNYDLIFAI